MVVSLSTNDQEGYVRHNGWDNRTENYEVWYKLDNAKLFGWISRF
jgi:hypothetical protein